MAIILRYFAEFCIFRGQLRKSGCLAINRFSPEKCHKVHQQSTTDAQLGEMMQNNGHYAGQDHSRSPILLPIESPYATSY